MFKISNQEDFRKEYPEFVSQFSHFYGSYELHGFGRYDGYRLKMGSIIDGLHQLTPIWKKKYTINDSQYFIFFNQTESQWELHEGWELHSGISSSMTIDSKKDHLYCATGLTNQFLVYLYKMFRWQQNANP